MIHNIFEFHFSIILPSMELQDQVQSKFPCEIHYYNHKSCSAC